MQGIAPRQAERDQTAGRKEDLGTEKQRAKVKERRLSQREREKHTRRQNFRKTDTEMQGDPVRVETKIDGSAEKEETGSH